MKLNSKNFKGLVAGSLLLVSFLFASRAGISGQSFQAAPDFQINDLEGKTHTLKDYRGKILLINFWATWCPPCRAEIPDFIEVYSAEKDKGLAILGISVDDLPASELLNFVRRFKINYPVALATSEIINQFQPGEFIPTTIFIDKNGRIRHKHVGLLDKKTLLTYLNQLRSEN
jgi:cytochrome c biogenesis protein CcmG/thiol:disulfide interchange protein DsbE